MKHRLHRIILLAAAWSATSALPVRACTSLLVTKKASADGSVMITYTCDGEFHPHLEYEPAADHEPGDSLEITKWGGEILGRIPQVPHTYAVVGMMNEHQLVIGETTFDGREELKNPEGLLHYWDLITLALERARTARGAITVMTDLVAQYGYRATGESFSIADPKEAWIMEMIGPGPGGSGAAWVARRVPDGMISCHANKARIGSFPMDDPQNCMYSDNVISLAVEKGYYDPESGEPFSYREAYCPSTGKNRRWADARVWTIFRRAAPSREFSPDYHRGIVDAEPYPLWIRPDKKLSVEDVFALMRDHYEGTRFDMTRGVDAGPYGNPNRWRPLFWEVDSTEYAWERPVSTQQTGFSFVSQSRAHLPDPVGGVFWYGLDDTYATCYFPLYCGIDAVPTSYTRGSLRAFSWESAWWVFNLVSNFVCLKYAHMMPEVAAVQGELEGLCRRLQPAVEEVAIRLAKKDPELLTRYLTDYSITRGEIVATRWRALAEHLITKFNDGYVQTEPGEPEDLGYSETWLRRVLRDRPDQFTLPALEPEAPAGRLVD